MDAAKPRRIQYTYHTNKDACPQIPMHPVQQRISLPKNNNATREAQKTTHFFGPQMDADVGVRRVTKPFSPFSVILVDGRCCESATSYVRHKTRQEEEEGRRWTTGPSPTEDLDYFSFFIFYFYFIILTKSSFPISFSSNLSGSRETHTFIFHLVLFSFEQTMF